MNGFSDWIPNAKLLMKFTLIGSAASDLECLTLSLWSRLHRDWAGDRILHWNGKQAHFSPQSFGKTSSADGSDPPSAQSRPELGPAFSSPMLLFGRRAAEAVVSLQAVRRVSAVQLWPEHKSSESPCSGAHSPARPPRSGCGRWTGSCRGRVWRRTEAESGFHPNRVGGCCCWRSRISDGTHGWISLWWPLLSGFRLPPRTGCCLAPLQVNRSLVLASHHFHCHFQTKAFHLSRPWDRLLRRVPRVPLL